MAPFAATPHLPRNSIGLSRASDHENTPAQVLTLLRALTPDNAGVEIMSLILWTR